MQNEVFRCQNCGAECSFNDDYCRRCFIKIERNNSIESEIEEINGVSVSQWSNMLEKNSDRYLSIFRKNEHKRVFLHINWAASFFTIYWFFYRKMYLYGVLSLVVTLLISMFSLFSSSIILKNEILELRQMEIEYQESIADGIDFEELAHIHTLEKEYFALDDANLLKAFGIMLIINLSFSFVLGLFCDCLYRYFLLHKGLYNDAGISGVSIWAAVLIVFIYNKISKAILMYIASWIGSNLIR